ncbi:MAG: NAD(P)/FAD-dependent oxidoreductase [Actinomycetota bacterium]
MARHRVVVVGGGFGGLACARALDGSRAEVTLLDRHNYHLFTPLLYQVATALLDPSDIAFPLRRAFRKSSNVRFRQALVTGVDFDRKVVRVGDRSEIPYDSLVLATGSANNYFGNQPLAEHTIGMKALAEAMRLRNHVLSCLERAARATDPDERRSWMTFVVVGGGPTGVEYAGALGELFDIVLGKDYPELHRNDARIVLVEGLDRLLGAFHPTLGVYAEQTLPSLGVEMRLGTIVERATEDSATLSNGDTIETHTVVWSAGVRSTDPLDPEMPRSRTKRLDVDERLQLRGHPDVFVIGDAASVATPHDELPMLSPPAMQEGRYVAATIKGRLGGRSAARTPFRYVDKGTMATIGRHAAVADVRGFKLKGFIGWLTWLGVHIYYLIGFHNRLVVLASWGWNYLLRDRPIRLIVRSDPDAVAEDVDPPDVRPARRARKPRGRTAT